MKNSVYWGLRIVKNSEEQDGATSESSSSGEHQLKDHTFPQQQQQYQIKYFSANANLFSYTLNRTTLNYN